ncbi:MAG: DUF2400 family protein [Bacteroides sp.]|nr:MAG: DUF2400 family protein [Bacteroides sp.]
MQENKFKKLRIIFDKIYDNINFDYFVKYDPIQIPHLFKNKKDIETISLFTAILSWGRRSIIINKCYEIIKIMNYQPYNFVMQHSNKDLSLFKNFRHRTFNHIDIVNIIKSLKYFYTLHNSIEDIFLKKKILI